MRDDHKLEIRLSYYLKKIPAHRSSAPPNIKEQIAIRRPMRIIADLGTHDLLIRNNTIGIGNTNCFPI